MSKTIWKKLQMGFISLSAVGLLAACGTDDNEDPMDDGTAVDQPMDDEMGEEEVAEDMPMEAEENIVSIAQSNPDFSILVAALQEAGLVETLQGDGPFTVFAPTDAAFEKLLMDLDITAEELLAQPDLEKVLTYHVVSGQVMAADLTDGMEAATVNGEEVSFDLSGDPMVNESMITSTDIEASNGVVHAIDTVMVPADFELQEVEAE